MRDAAGADASDAVTVEITRAGDEPEIRVPMDLRKALGGLAAGAGGMGGHYSVGAARLDFFDQLGEAGGNAAAANCESVRHAGFWEAEIVLFSWREVDYEGKRKILRDVASVAELAKPFFTANEKIECRETFPPGRR